MTWNQWPLEQLEREYSPSSVAPDFMRTIKQYQALSAMVLAIPDNVTKISYGPHQDEFNLLHFADKTASDPLACASVVGLSNPIVEHNATLVFIHGGYWQELSAQDSLFGAQALGRLGINWAAINYGLAPTVSLEAIVQRCAAALKMLAQRNAKSQFVLVGSSAGAHLVASLMADTDLMTALTGRIAGAVLLSGVYDLEPLVHTYINKALGLSKQSARQLSPITQKFNCAFPVLMAYGERETLEFKRQSAELAQHLRSNLLRIQLLEITNRDHFDIVFDISDPDSVIGKTLHSWLSIPVIAQED